MSGSDIAPSSEKTSAKQKGLYFTINNPVINGNMAGVNLVGDGCESDGRPQVSVSVVRADYIHKVKVRQERERKYVSPSAINSTLDAVDGYLERVDFLSGISSIQNQLDSQAKSIKELKIIGISGSGKTELAKAYARQYKGLFAQLSSQAATSSSAPSEIRPLIYILNARHENYLSQFEKFAKALNIDVDYHKKIFNPEASENKRKEYENQLASEISQALCDYPQWLLIIEADADADMKMISHLIPKKEDLIGTIIYTQRSTALTQAELRYGKLPIPVIDLRDGLSDTDAVALLVSLTGIPEDNFGSALALAKKLDKLPLALQVAARYINLQPNVKAVRTDDYQSYLAEYEKALVDLDKRQKEQYLSLDIPLTQYTAIELSVKALPDASQQLLRFCGLLATRDLPQSLLRDYSIHFLGQSATADINTDEAFTFLRQHGLLNLQDIDKQTWFIHQITHTYARLNLLSTDNIETVKHALMLLDDDEYDMPMHFKLLNQLYPHVVAFIDYMNQLTLPMGFQHEIRPFFIKWSKRASVLGHQNKAIAWLNQALGNQTEIHAEVEVEIHQQLGVAYGRMGRVIEEVRCLEQALALSNSSMSEKQMIIHIDLGNVYSKLGDEEKQHIHYTSAFNILKQRMQNKSPVEGIEINFLMNLIGSGFFERANTNTDVDVVFDGLLTCFSCENEYNLAIARLIIGNAYGRYGNIARQEKLVKLALDYFEKNQEQYILDYAKALVSYSNVMSEMGEAEQQLALLEKALDIQRVHCKEENHTIAITVLNMSCAYHDLDQHKKAEEILIKEARGRITPPLLPCFATCIAKAYLHIEGKSSMARELLLNSKELQESNGDKVEDVPLFAETLLYLGVEAFSRNSVIEAKNYLLDALSFEYGYYQQQTVLTARTLMQLSAVNISLKIYDAAYGEVRAAIEILEYVFVNKKHKLIMGANEMLELINDIKTSENNKVLNKFEVFHHDDKVDQEEFNYKNHGFF